MKTCTCCGKFFTPEQWDALACIGVTSFEGEAWESRNCDECESTISIPLFPWPAEVLADFLAEEAA